MSDEFGIMAKFGLGVDLWWFWVWNSFNTCSVRASTVRLAVPAATGGSKHIVGYCFAIHADKEETWVAAQYG